MGFQRKRIDISEDRFEEIVSILRSKISAHSPELAVELEDMISRYLDDVFKRRVKEAIDLCEMAADLYIGLSSIDPSIRMSYFEEFIADIIRAKGEEVERRISATVECFRKEVIKRRS